MRRYLKISFPLITLLPFLLLILGLIACDTNSGSSDKGQSPATKSTAATIPAKIVLATIDSQAVTGADLQAYLALFQGQESRLPEGIEARNKLLDHLLDRKLLLIAAAKAGYDKLDELKKHGSLGPTEKETLILRAYLTDKISRPATPDEAAVAAWRKEHPNLNVKEAREKLAAKNQKKLFRQLMTKLRKEHKIVIQRNSLDQLPAA